jgi:hypothetical protein
MNSGFIELFNPNFNDLHAAKSEILRKNFKKITRFEEISEKLQTIQLVKRNKGRSGLSSSNLTLVLNKPRFFKEAFQENFKEIHKKVKNLNKTELKRENFSSSNVKERENKNSMKESTKSMNSSSGFLTVDSKSWHLRKQPSVVNFSIVKQNENSCQEKKIFRTTVSAARFRKNYFKNKEDGPQFPALQVPLRMKKQQDLEVASKSFADLKSLPIHRLSIESNIFSRIRKIRGKLQ